MSTQLYSTTALPQFISNDYKNGKKVLATLEDELLHCEEFIMSVAFITSSGIVSLLPIFKELEDRNIKGKILTTDYLAFSEPKALMRLSEFSNIELKMYRVETPVGFHTKGYIFKKEQDMYRILVGSSNMTASALTTNKEWNTKITSNKSEEYVQDLLEEFFQIWNSENSRYYQDIQESYSELYVDRKIYHASIQKEKPIDKNKLKPNLMQRSLIDNLRKIKAQGKNKALLISATGTGKTYASAFSIQDDQAKKVLFLVHREQIAKQAMETYKRVFGNTRTFGILSGSHKDTNVDFLFATMQIMSKKEVYEQFSKDNFEVIVIDEAHRVGSSSYQKIMEYFQPRFWLGMTASPERTDDFDVYATFDHNIAYEIRLQQALEEDLLCPFHYFGITDFRINDQEMDFTDFSYLTSDDRVKYILQQSEFFGCSGKRVKGLIFCSSKKEAITLSEKMNQRGYRTLALSGDDSQEKRANAIEQLVTDNEDHLDYILTVDIFNEGVDIPEINQVILLRPTESPIVFIQQLGRGLRKFKDKEYVVILDFIGNYKNNFMIPVALSGDQTYNKDNIRRYVNEGQRVIPGASTIYFDAIAKKQIFASIDAANFTEVRLIKENYKNLKYKLGHIPSLSDFDKYGQMDVLRMFENKNLQSYYNFLVKYEKEYKTRINKTQESMIRFVSTKLASGKRIEELLLMKILLHQEDHIFETLKDELKYYKINLTDKLQFSIVQVLTNEFPSSASKKTFADCIFIEPDRNDYKISKPFKKQLETKEFKSMLEELIEFGLFRNQRDYIERYKNTDFVLYQKYTYEDVCRLLCWKQNEVPLNIGGYKFDSYTKSFPVFINYEKDENIQDTIKYEDRFVTENQLIAISKSKRTLDSDDVKNFIFAKERGIDVHLFVRKNKEDNGSKEFYYLGCMETNKDLATQFVMPEANTNAVEIKWNLDSPVREDIYQYIVNG